MSLSNYKSYVDGTWIESKDRSQLRSPFNGDPVATVHMANAETLEKAMQASAHATEGFRKISRYMKSRVLSLIAQEIENHRADFIKKIAVTSR